MFADGFGDLKYRTNCGASALHVLRSLQSGLSEHIASAQTDSLDPLYMEKTTRRPKGKSCTRNVCYHVEHVVMIDGAKYYAITDMIFDGKQPIAVLIWGGSQEKNTLWCPWLDLVHFSEHRDGQITHRYEHPIEDHADSVPCPIPLWA